MKTGKAVDDRKKTNKKGTIYRQQQRVGARNISLGKHLSMVDALLNNYGCGSSLPSIILPACGGRPSREILHLLTTYCRASTNNKTLKKK
jgi:hypothetical protein